MPGRPFNTIWGIPLAILALSTPAQAWQDNQATWTRHEFSFEDERGNVTIHSSSPITATWTHHEAAFEDESAPAQAWQDNQDTLFDWERTKLENARRDWQNVQRWDDSRQARLYDWEIEDALRRGRQGDLSWESDFDRLMEERRHEQRNAEAIEAARWEWEMERSRGRSAHTRPIDRTIGDTLDNAEWDPTGSWRMDFDRQMRARRTVREQIDDRPRFPSLPPPALPAIQPPLPPFGLPRARQRRWTPLSSL